MLRTRPLVPPVALVHSGAMRLAPRPLRCAFVAFLALASAPALAQELPPPPPEMDDLIVEYAADQDSVESFYRLPLATRTLDRIESFNEEWAARLSAVPFEELDSAGRVDYLLLRNLLQHRSRRLDREREKQARLRELLPFADTIVELEEARRELRAAEPRADATRVDDVADQVEGVLRRVRRGLEDADAKGALVVPREVASRALREVEALGKSLDAWFDHRDGYEPEFGWWLREPRKRAKGRIDELAKLLRDKVVRRGDDASGIVGEAIGRDALTDELRFEAIPYSPEELLAIAEREFAWCEARAAEQVQALGLESWLAAVEHVKSLHVPPGEQDDLVAAQGRAAVEFVESRNLIRIPSLAKETWRTAMVSAQRQKMLPFAAYSGQSMWIAYPTEGMPHDAKLMAMRGNNEHMTRIVTPHELIPGHHLQLYFADRHATHRKLFRTAFLVEGWALYWEMRLWELGWPRGPEDRIGMLFWRMHRCARIIVTVRYHLGRMTPVEMVDFLEQRVGLERDGATAEVRRYVSGGYGALYQCAYMTGGLQLRALHRELVEREGWSEADFHAAVLAQNSIPVELLRLAVRGLRPGRDWEPSWRFAGDPEVVEPAPATGGEDTSEGE